MDSSARHKIKAMPVSCEKYENNNYENNNIGCLSRHGLKYCKAGAGTSASCIRVSRNPVSLQALKSKLQNMERLKVIQGDVLAPDTFEHELKDVDVVVSSIGMSSDKPTTLYSQGILHILNAMTKYQVPRLICVSALGLEVTSGMSLPLKLATRLILQPLLKNTFSDMLRMESAVKKSDVNWTIVRPPRLTSSKLRGKYRVAIEEHLRHPLIIGRDDLAHFILHAISQQDTYCATVEVSY